MSARDESTPERLKVKLKSLRQLKRDGRETPGRTAMRRHLAQSQKRWRPRGGWRNS